MALFKLRPAALWRDHAHEQATGGRDDTVWIIQTLPAHGTATRPPACPPAAYPHRSGCSPPAAMVLFLSHFKAVLHARSERTLGVRTGMGPTAVLP